MRKPVIVSDSVLVRTAVEMADRHPPSKGIEGEIWCLRCWEPWPCTPAQHALEVCRAAGLGSSAPVPRRDELLVGAFGGGGLLD